MVQELWYEFTGRISGWYEDEPICFNLGDVVAFASYDKDRTLVTMRHTGYPNCVTINYPYENFKKLIEHVRGMNVTVITKATKQVDKK